ncbi:MAG: type I CRISPR-associated protein Cas7 [Eubacteriaceae bacterium]|nr:type I CRISPR-associated protein Cas7 [Eubacteriaceae bacterium]
MNKRVYGIIGIKSVMANWNADFSGMPKTLSTGEVFGSDKACKYPMKRMWQDHGEKVMYMKSFKFDKEKKKNEDSKKMRPRSLKERYELLFDVEDLKKVTDNKEVLTHLFEAIDIKNFGATFAEGGKNVSITGAVQIGQGFNKYAGHNIEEQQILSPFRDAKKDTDEKEADQSTLGTKIVSNEAHYFYGFAITPKVYADFVDMGVTDGYSETDYKKFKEAALVAATGFNTNAKMGCENEFGLFVETEEDTYLPDLSQYVSFERSEGEKGVIDMSKASALFADMKDSISKIEVYYNPYTTELKGIPDQGETLNLFTREEV